VNDPRAQRRSAHRHRRLCQTRRTRCGPYGISRGLVVTRPFAEVENSPHEGHADAAGSAVTTWTTLPPNTSLATSRTANPSRSNNRDPAEATLSEPT